jgi:hypothetical protein
MQVAYAPVRLAISDVNLSIPGNQQLSPKPWKIAVGTGAPVDKISVALTVATIALVDNKDTMDFICKFLYYNVATSINLE